MSNQVKLFVVEGESRERRFLDWMIKCFFRGKYSTKIISLSAAQNIYMLYQLLKTDDFDSDLVEVLRDNVPGAGDVLEGISRQDISEIYMFFDYDVQQNNLSVEDGNISADELLNELLVAFDNETDNGKLYLSYPMSEALYDYKDNMCQAFSSCFVSVNQIDCYKTVSGTDNPKASLHLDIADWEDILNIFILRVKCLFAFEQLGFDLYKSAINPVSIMDKQCSLKEEKNEIFVLSAFPEFILDYFKLDFWSSMIKRNKYSYDYCIKQIDR